jgi:hypothetical protein
MAAEFTPLIASLKTSLAGTAAGPKPAAIFAPITTSTDASKVASAAPHAHSSVRIEVKKEGERISQIRVQCRCGEVIEIDCEY